MWLLLGFTVHHVYSAWLMDVKEKNGTLSSIFGGYKFVEPEDLE
jgi:Ni/Fe-hydrogenase 1 B-type cytochrome subunit